MRESAEPAGTDHTGDIVSFTAVGSGVGSTRPRPWICYTEPTNIFTLIIFTNVEWQTPDGVNIMRNATTTDDGVATRSVGGITPGIVLARGTNYFFPDGGYCCVLTMNGTESERRCITFSQY